jgi:CheY-specific phosphatase CheX
MSAAGAKGKATATPAWSEAPLLAALRECVESVFRTMLGSLARGAEHDGAAHAAAREGADLAAVVEFRGPLRGAVIVRCSHAGARHIARGMLALGEDDAVEPAEIQDALGECANMFTGCLKCKVLDPTGSFSLGTPRIGARVDHALPLHHGTLVYRLAEGAAAVELWLDEPSRRP